MADPIITVSPTGTPVVSPRVVPLLAVIPALLAGIGALVPSYTVVGHWFPIAAGALAGLFGILSPGLRK